MPIFKGNPGLPAARFAKQRQLVLVQGGRTAEKALGGRKKGMVWYGMMWYGVVWHGMAWHGRVG